MRNLALNPLICHQSLTNVATTLYPWNALSTLFSPYARMPPCTNALFTSFGLYYSTSVYMTPPSPLSEFDTLRWVALCMYSLLKQLRLPGPCKAPTLWESSHTAQAARLCGLPPHSAWALTYNLLCPHMWAPCTL